MANNLKPWSQRPFDPALGDHTNQLLDWMVGALNTLIGQSGVPSGKGFPALSPGVVDPTTAQLKSAGSRVASIVTPIASVPTANSITLFWDGTNGSALLRIYRDDNTITGPFSGSQLISGLLASTTYFIYPYFDEATQLVKFVAQAGAVGTPAIAYTSRAIVNLQAQILRGRVPLSSDFGVTGITTPAAGTGPTITGGGGSGEGAYLGRNLTL